MACTRIAFVDDHPLLLTGLTTIFRDDKRFSVVGAGKCVSDALEIADRCKPDVLIMDLNMAGNAFEAIGKISRKNETTKIVVLTASTGVDSAVRSLDAGAHGYVLKGGSADELVHAIRSVLDGQTYISQEFAGKVIAALRNESVRKAAAQAIKLSIREEQIVRLLLRGKTNKEIANALNICEKTVKHYMTVLMQKLNARNRLQVVIAAQKMNPEVEERSIN